MGKFGKNGRYKLMKEKTANIKLQSSCAFFPDAQPDAHEKMRNRLQFFFVSGRAALKKVDYLEIGYF